MKLRSAIICAAVGAIVVALFVALQSPVGATSKPRPGPGASHHWPGGHASSKAVRTALQKHRPTAPARVRHLDPRLQSAPARSGGTVEVNVHGDSRSLDAAVRKAGGRSVAAAGGVRSAVVPRKALATLAGAAGVTAVDQPVPAIPTDTFQDVAASGADVWQSAGQNGAGANIGIVDAGFTNLSSEVTAGNLPAGQTVTGNHCADVNDTQHGTAVTEVVHKMAPAATLFLYCIDDSIGFMQAESEIQQYNVDHPASPIKIVTSSLGFLGDSRGDGTGADTSAANTVKTARQAGILWIESAGNNGENHWSGTFADTRPHDGLADLNPTVNPAQADPESDDVAVGPQGSATLLLQWDHWPTTTPGDVITFVFTQYDCTTGDAIGSVQSTRAVAGQAPVLGFQVTNPTSSVACFAVAVQLGNAVAHYRYDLSYWGGVDGSSLYAALNPAAAATGSITEPASSPYALAVGASYWQDKTLEPFSSQGPTIDGRVKPDITGFDGVNVGAGLTDFSSGFYGTSAAAPNVAGAAALVSGANPGMDAAQLQDFLERRAGTTPATNQVGHGPLTLGTTSGIEPPTASGYTPLASPQRILDTRTTVGGHHGQLGATKVATVTVLGLPADATAVAINLTGTSVKQTTFLASYPGGSSWPGTSNVNLTTADSTAAVFAVVTLGPNHTINVRNQAGNVDALVDLLGYYAPSSTGQYGGVGPTRIVDTRTGLGGHTGALGNGQSVRYQLPDGSGVPADATSVIVNVTAANQASTGYLALSPNCSGATSTVNYLRPGYARANLSVTGLDANHTFCVYDGGGRADVIVDLVGYVGASGTARYVPLTSPVRIADTRSGNGGQHAALGAHGTLSLPDAGIFDVPANAKAMLVGLVGANPTATSYLEVFPGTAPPASPTSTLNLTVNRTVSNSAIASLSDGTFGIYNAQGAVQAIVDLFGYFV